jgi:hypothetical protein
MPIRDLCNDVKISQLFPPKAAVADNTPQVSNIIDNALFDSLTFVLVTGTLSDADASFTTLIEESNAANMSGANAVADEDLIGTEVGASFTFADDDKVLKLGYKGNKRYTRVTVTPANNTGNLFLAGVAILGHPRTRPQSAQKV